MSDTVQRLRDNATILLSPTGTRLPLAAVAGCLQLAADEIERQAKEIAQLRDNAERFKFIENHLAQGYSPHMDGTYVWVICGRRTRARTFAEAIDAQRAGEGK